MLKSKKMGFSFADCLMPVFFDLSHLEESIRREKEESTKKLNRDFYVLVDSKVAKMRIEMEKVESFEFEKSASLKCFVVEIDGSAVFPEESLKLSEEINVDGSTQISQEEGIEIMEKTLGNFNLDGPVKFVSDELAQGQIKINFLRKRINENKKRREA